MTVYKEQFENYDLTSEVLIQKFKAIASVDDNFELNNVIANAIVLEYNVYRNKGIPIVANITIEKEFTKVAYSFPREYIWLLAVVLLIQISMVTVVISYKKQSDFCMQAYSNFKFIYPVLLIVFVVFLSFLITQSLSDCSSAIQRFFRQIEQ